MIPLQLHLTDFLSYRSMAAPLDFTQIRLACLSGANGNGKSALLDAITWSLWG
ncbi:MAG: AAA family ATPase, partial [Actinomycetota bacterium]